MLQYLPMNKLRVAVLSAILVGGLLYSQKATVLAYTDGEDYILSFLRVTVMAQFQTLQGLIGDSNSQTAARFDSIDSKLDRIYASCGRTTTPTRRVTTAQATTCVNTCFTNSTISGASSGAGTLDQGRFISCISRCPSNTLRNQDCAQRYTRITQGGSTVNGQLQIVSYAPSRVVEHCITGSEARYHAQCRLYGETLSAGIAACLVDSQVYTCQQDCDTNYRNSEAYMLCTLRCNGRARSTEIYNGLRDSGFINEQGELGFDTLSNTTIQLPAAAPTAPAAPTTPTTLTPTTETYAQCVYRCDSDRTSCLALVPQPTTCQDSYNTCYSGCTARLTTGVSR